MTQTGLLLLPCTVMMLVVSPNLIVEARPPEQTTVATGVNTVMRTLSGTVGGQVGPSLIAGTVTPAGLPTDRGFTAFVLAGGACLLAAVASLAVPKRPHSGVEGGRLEPVAASGL